MEIQSDFKEQLELFNENKVEYLIVGAYAMALHGAPRFTGDIDLFVKPESENAKRILVALEAFGFGSVDLSEEDFTKSDNVIQLGVPPVRIDMLTSLTGVTWQDANANRIKGDYGGVAVYFLSKRDIIKGAKKLRNCGKFLTFQPVCSCRT